MLKPAPDLKDWIKRHGIHEIECLVPDMNGIARGKILPVAKFLKSEGSDTLRFPSSAFTVAITGRYTGSNDDDALYTDADMVLRPDLASLCLAPGFASAKAYVYGDTYDSNGEPWPASPRHQLKKVMQLYSRQGWRPVVAPELEFYLTEPNPDPDLPLTPAVGRSGRAETVPEPYGLEAINEYETLITDIHKYSATAALELDTMIHESGTAQLEINFHHGDPVLLSDQVLLFKRIVRQAAQKHGARATFMAKPVEGQPGSSMHLHISLVDERGGANLFADDTGDSALFRHFVGGLQKYLPEVSPLFAPNVNSFRRLRPAFSAPINVQWGYDNRSCGLRVPASSREGRRIENRLPGADANPYLAIAATLICGYLGIEEKAEPTPQATGNAYHNTRTLPRTLEEALERFGACGPVRDLLGEPFTRVFTRIKEAELDAFQSVITPWERDHLLLKA